jgi:uncharacterized membrane protein
MYFLERKYVIFAFLLASIVASIALTLKRTVIVGGMIHHVQTACGRKA